MSSRLKESDEDGGVGIPPNRQPRDGVAFGVAGAELAAVIEAEEDELSWLVLPRVLRVFWSWVGVPGRMEMLSFGLLLLALKLARPVVRFLPAKVVTLAEPPAPVPPLPKRTLMLKSWPAQAVVSVVSMSAVTLIMDWLRELVSPTNMTA